MTDSHGPDYRPDPGEIVDSMGPVPKSLKNLSRAVQEAYPTSCLRVPVVGELLDGICVSQRKRMDRRKLLAEVYNALERKSDNASSDHAEMVTQQFFTSAMRNPQWSFISILSLSFLTALAGVALLSVAIYISLFGDLTTVNEAIIAGVFGASGVAGTALSFLGTARRGVSLANANNAQIRLALAGFATELGHIRAVKLETMDDVKEANRQIGEAMTRAMELLGEYVRLEAQATGPRRDRRLDGQ